MGCDPAQEQSILLPTDTEGGAPSESRQSVADRIVDIDTVSSICVQLPTVPPGRDDLADDTAMLRSATRQAVERWAELPLAFTIGWTELHNDPGCDTQVGVFIGTELSNLDRIHADFPGSHGYPGPSITVGEGKLAEIVDEFVAPEVTLKVAIQHEIGHTLGFRHTDWKDRASCEGLPDHDPDGDGNSLGAHLIPGSSADDLGSIMRACLPPSTDLSFSAGDRVAIRRVYGRGFCGKFDGYRIALRTKHERWVRAEGGSQGFDVDQAPSIDGQSLFRVVCPDPVLRPDTVTFESAFGRRVQGMGGTVAQASSGTTAGTLWRAHARGDRHWAFSVDGTASFMRSKKSGCVSPTYDIVLAADDGGAEPAKFEFEPLVQ
ncbi:MAG: M57 family metalloprotease [Myxococcota bacterium]